MSADLPKLMTFEVYADKKHEWRWRLRARNGRIVADGAEGYVRKQGCVVAVVRIKKALAVNGPFLWVIDK